jgi:hypothetical protein
VNAQAQGVWSGAAAFESLKEPEDAMRCLSATYKWAITEWSTQRGGSSSSSCFYSPVYRLSACSQWPSSLTEGY